MCRGVGGQRAVEPGRVGLLVAKARQQPHRAAQRRPPREQVGHGHRPTLKPGRIARLCRMSGRALGAAAVLARYRPPAGRRQRDLPAAHRRPAGRCRRRRHAADRPLPGRAAARGRRRRADQPRGRPLLGVHLGAAGDGRRRGSGSARCAGATRRGRRHPERPAVPGPAGLRPPGRGAGAPLPPRAVAGGGPVARAGSAGSSSRWLSPRLHRAQPVRDGVTAVGARSGRPRGGQRADRRGAQRPRRGAACDR